MSTIIDNQSVFDLAIQNNGDARAAILIAIENDLRLTQDLEAGTEFNQITTEFDNENVKNYYFSKGRQSATAEPITETVPIGIGVMIVGSDFDVT